MSPKFKRAPKIERGFSLIEILVVIGILAILLTITLVAINPTRNTQDARNTKRRSDVLNILDAVNQYYIAVGSFPSGTPAAGAAAIPIKSSAGGTLAAFCNNLVTAYIAALPVDPQNGSWTDCATHDTGYTIQQSLTNGRITINAPSAEAGASISATR